MTLTAYKVCYNDTNTPFEEISFAFGSNTRSVIIPCRNAVLFLDECLQSILDQTCLGQMKVEISLFDDSSDDGSFDLAYSYRKLCSNRGVVLTINRQSSNKPSGVANAKNSAVKNSSGQFLCFLDADDYCDVDRIRRQYELAINVEELSLIGSKFKRLPDNSTKRYTKWANNLTNLQLYTQIYTSNGPTLIAPTWFCSRRLYDVIGGFSDNGRTGFPEDLDFFYKALRKGACLYKVDDSLVTYRYHSDCASFSVSEETILSIRVAEFERIILEKRGNWSKFSIWNVGKSGKKFFNALKPENRRKVLCFGDIDSQKIDRKFFECYVRNNNTKKFVIQFKLPIIHISELQPPVVICVKMDLTGGMLEKYVEEKNWIEGENYFYLC
uniref:Glycosyltransferase 2-like domain-containing protein n=1 Tax=Romanomermis culicivorax TaxID=13658 RepID=A0A915IQL4_ROMCU